MAMFNIDCDNCARKSVCRIFNEINQTRLDKRDTCDNLYVKISCMDNISTETYTTGYSRPVKFVNPEDFRSQCCVECKSSKYCIYCDDEYKSNKSKINNLLSCISNIQTKFDILRTTVACAAFDDIFDGINVNK